jgi:hypothetical protein
MLVKNLTEGKVTSADAALALIQQGLDNRKVRHQSKGILATTLLIVGHNGLLNDVAAAFHFGLVVPH